MLLNSSRLSNEMKKRHGKLNVATRHLFRESKRRK
jgi:hypothetical protein